jgi:inosine/xanthosine triphosphatase
MNVGSPPGGSSRTTMTLVGLASKNPVKLAAALAGFQRMFAGEEFEVRSIPVSSGVAHQPRSDGETLRGATERAQQARGMFRDAHYWVGIEGGVEDQAGAMAAFAWVVILSRDGKVGKARSGTFFLPDAVADLVRQGKELGEADDVVFSRANSKQEEGAIGLLTGNVLDRGQLYTHTVILALVPFKNRALYRPA